MTPDTGVTMALPPDELSRRISQIDLTAMKAKDTLPEYGPRYSKDDLLKLRPETHDGHVDALDLMLDGVKTPTSPPAPPPSTPADKLNEVGQGNDDEEVQAPPSGEVKKKKKKSKKSSGANKKAPATGFEPYYADPPITPDEHEEERDLYSATRSFPERIQTCIQRYRQRRKLDETRALIITKYFMLGGIEAATSKSFTGGLDTATIDNSTADEIAAIQATDFIRVGASNGKYFDPLKPEGWVVDFEGVVKGFLSHTAPRHIGETDEQISQYCAVVKNFLNYVLAHAVCPEYTEDVFAARKICDMAAKELPALSLLNRLLPGDFNVAASTLYGGRYQGLRLVNEQWGAIDPLAKEYLAFENTLDESEAQRIFKTAIAMTGSEEMFKKVSAEEVEIVATEKRFLEVISIEQPRKEIIAEYSTIKNERGETGYIKALGLLRCKTWDGPGIEEEDMTDDEDNDNARVDDALVESFWLENNILEHCFIGMKLEVTVHELNIGIKFFDCVAGLYCSFYSFLPNEKMTGWKEPKPNTRAPPTEDDPDAEEGAILGEMERDIEEDEKISKKLTIQSNLEPVAEA